MSTLRIIAAVVGTLTVTTCFAQLRIDMLEKYALAQYDAVPISGEDPVMALQLCEVPHSDPCALRAWIEISLPSGARAQVPQAALADPKAQGRIDLGGHPAVEKVWQGAHSIHVHMIVAHDQIYTMRGNAIVNCYGWSEPSEFHVFVGSFRELCANYDLSKLKSG